MKKIFDILRIKSEERTFAIIAFIVVGMLNAILVAGYYNDLTPLSDNYWKLFLRKFHVSGFDPITYYVLSDWHQSYNVFRHPLLGYMMWPFAMLNKGLMMLTGINCALFIVAVMQTVLGGYSAVMLNRILTMIVGLSRRMSAIVTAMFLGFGFIMLSVMVPDHFGPSMCLLLTSLYIAGRLMQKGRELTIWQTILYFTLTAGVSLSNGLKIFLAGLFTNGKRTFRWKYVLFAVVIPSLLMWYGARKTYVHFVYPYHLARIEARKKAPNKNVTVVKNADGTKKKVFKKKRVTTGKPIAKGEFMGWTDISTPRGETIIHNLMGESIQLHDDYCLQDQLINRPVIVRYNLWINYFVEAVICLLFIVGIWCGRHSRFLWLALAYFGMDMALHIGLGFGINEIYIMAPHYLVAMPIAIAYLLKSAENGNRNLYAALCCTCLLLALWLWSWNGSLTISYLV